MLSLELGIGPRILVAMSEKQYQHSSFPQSIFLQCGYSDIPSARFCGMSSYTVYRICHYLRSQGCPRSNSYLNYNNNLLIGQSQIVISCHNL